MDNKKTAHYENVEPRNRTKNYTDGEEHIYLGRPYRLKIISGTVNEGELSGDRLVISCIEEPYSEKVKQLLEGWYWTKAEKSFTGYIEKWWLLFEKKGFNRPRLRIKKMKTRWGSLSTKGNLSLNVDLIKAPEECIEYLVVHELCHLEQHNHGPDFYRLLEELIPNWREKKQDLEKALMFNRSF